MKIPSIRNASPYLPAHTDRIFPNMHGKLCFMGSVLKVRGRVLPRFDGTVHLRHLDNLDNLVIDNYRQFELHLSHPTRRLQYLLWVDLAAAEQELSWLRAHPIFTPKAPRLNMRYLVACELIGWRLAEWRLSIDYLRAQHRLDEQAWEIIH